jgi:hypothetical protein
MANGSQGDGAAAAKNTEITILIDGTTGPDPAKCSPLTDWYLAYGQRRADLLTCSINGTTARFTANVAPSSPLVFLAMTYLPTMQQI